MPDTREATKVEFLQFHQPPLDSGKYHIRVDQTLSSNEINADNKFSQTLTFVIAGHRFAPLTSEDINSIYPPSESLGEYANVIPHIILNRSTLPWERSIDGAEHSDLPWLTLLLFRESEKPTGKTITVEELNNTTSAKFPPFSYEIDEELEKDDEITIIDVPKSVLEKIIPTRRDLAYLAHIRQPAKADGTRIEGADLATVLCNRLPLPGDVSTVHLVSLENRYLENGENFDFQGAGSNELIRLVSLASWSFSSLDPKKNFTELLLNINRNPDTLRLPNLENQDVNQYLTQGYVALPHALRQGDKTVSWYHGPLSPGQSQQSLSKSLWTADQLIHYDPSNGLFDISYGAAWQLGRMLTLNNQPVATALYHWKRANAQYLKELQQQVIHLPFSVSRRLRSTEEQTPIPSIVEQWFKDLELLKGIPFNYFVPDERMLPPESLRFFWVDSYWVDCLQDGAFSIGRVTSADVEVDEQNRQARARSLRSHADTQLTGFLLRSEVVSGWPDLEVDGYLDIITEARFIPRSSTPVTRLRMDRLSDNVLLCLFNAPVKTVDIHLKPEAMHFGVESVDIDDIKITKELRDPEQIGAFLDPPIDVPLKNKNSDLELAVIEIEQLANTIKGRLNSPNFTSAQFAQAMVEGVPKVRFTSINV